MVALDSNHTRTHVAAELERYAPLVTPGSYCVVFDGVMTMVSDAPNAGEEWQNDNPLEAVDAFLAEHSEFEVDERSTVWRSPTARVAFCGVSRPTPSFAEG